MRIGIHFELGKIYADQGHLEASLENLDKVIQAHLVQSWYCIYVCIFLHYRHIIWTVLMSIENKSVLYRTKSH